MQIGESIKISYAALRAKKSRTFLTMLGIIIGIGSVIIIMSVGAGAQSLIINQIKSMGSNLISVFPGKSDEEGPPSSVMGVINTSLKRDDAKALADINNVPYAIAVTGYNRGVGTVSWHGNEIDSTFVGVDATYTAIEDIEVADGRFFTAEENDSLLRYAVLGNQIIEDLFYGENPIGQNIKIKKTTFTVIGYFPKRGTKGFENQDSLIFIPSYTAQKLLLGIDYYSILRVRADSEENIDQTMNDVRVTLSEQHDIDRVEEEDFSVRSQKDALDMMLVITDALKFFLAAIAAISLIVGGVGIMNIMLVAVSERTREIGLRKAVGAKRAAIMNQFLIESVIVTLFGGIIGIIGGALFSVLIALIARSLGYDWDLVVSLSSIGLATSISVIVGLIFGIYPAKRAAKLNPIEALHYE